MWRRTYLLLLLLRVYFALSPSYLHPDEIFQGPEVISGSIFPYPIHRTWEWTSDHPIRSVFPLWFFYGLPMSLLKSVWTRDEDGLVEPAAIYYSLRLVMFILSFVLEDWAIYELVNSPRRRKKVVLLVASSYVTWSFQTHTFSNSIETLLVLWCLVLIDRIVKAEKRTSAASCLLLGFLLILGVFNRITFPAFVVIPSLRLVPHFVNRPISFCLISLSAIVWLGIAVATDTAYYTGPQATKSFRALFLAMRKAPVMTIFNNILYNTQTSNLAHHGLHPHYQHILINLPQLLGPAIVLLIWSAPECTTSRIKQMLSNPRLTSAATGTLLLSIIPHQEPRFLIPCVPLLLSCIRLPRTKLSRRTFWISWAIFNAALGILMGVYHQGGVIPTQIAIPSLVEQSLGATQSKAESAEVFWWKTYPPPTYLVGINHTNPYTSKALNITTTTLLDTNQAKLQSIFFDRLAPCQPTIMGRISSLTSPPPPDLFLAAPLSTWRFEHEQQYPPISNFSFELRDTIGANSAAIRFNHLSTSRKHVNLDDLDFGDDGFVPTISRVIGRRGLGVWHVKRVCIDQ